MYEKDTVAHSRRQRECANLDCSLPQRSPNLFHVSSPARANSLFWFIVSLLKRRIVVTLSGPFYYAIGFLEYRRTFKGNTQDKIPRQPGFTDSSSILHSPFCYCLRPSLFRRPPLRSRFGFNSCLHSLLFWNSASRYTYRVCLLFSFCWLTFARNDRLINFSQPTRLRVFKYFNLRLHLHHFILLP